MKSWFRKFQLIFSVFISITVVAYLLFKVDFETITQVVSTASLNWIAVGFLFFLFYQVFRTARFSVLFHSRKGDLFNLFSVQCIHAFLNNVLPAGTGELAYIVVLKRLYRIPIPEGATTLYLARTADLATFVLLFGILHLSEWQQMPEAVEYVMRIMVVLTGLLVISAILAATLGPLMVTKIQAVLNFNSNNRYSWLTMIFDKVVATIDSFRVIRSTTVYVLVLFFSIIMWAFMYLTYFAVVRAFHLELDLSQVLFLFLIMWPVSLLPVKGILNLGTFEGGWVLGLLLLGLTESTGIAVALGAHTILFVYVIGVLIFPLILYSPRFANNLLKNSAIMQQPDKLS